MLQKGFTWLLRAAMGGGLVAGAGFLSGGKATDWSYDMASEQFPFLKDMEDTAFGEYAKNNWPVVAGGIAAYLAAPKGLRGVVGFATIATMAYKAFSQYTGTSFLNSAAPEDGPDLALKQAQRRAEFLAGINIAELETTPGGLVQTGEGGNFETTPDGPVNVDQEKDPNAPEIVNE